MSVHIKRRAGKRGPRWLVYWRRGGRAFREQYAGSFATLKEARARRDLIAGELAAGRDPQLALDALRAPPAPPPTLGEQWDRFIVSRVDVGEKAQAQYRNARDRWLPLLGADTDPGMIGTDDVIAGVAELYDGGEGLAASTVAQYLSNLALVLDFADVTPNPARSAKVRLPGRASVEKAIPATPAWLAIRDLTRRRSRLALELQEACAFRVNEVCALTWGDVDLVEGMVRVRREHAKTAAGRRWVPVPPVLLDRVDELVPVEDRRADALVLGVRSSIVYLDLVGACVKAGAPRYGTHALRHRRISLWLRHGVDPVQVSRWAGHSRTSMSLDTYGHVVLDPREDEHRDFWLSVYEGDRARERQP